MTRHEVRQIAEDGLRDRGRDVTPENTIWFLCDMIVHMRVGYSPGANRDNFKSKPVSGAVRHRDVDG